MDFRFVDYIPEQLEEGIVYIAPEFGAVMHLCCDGCGEKVSTPLNPAQWTLTFDGDTISLSPSIGSFDLACGSHYWIRKNRVHWSGSMSRRAIDENAARDIEAAQQHFASSEPTAHKRPGFWRRLFRRG
jgi:hypothetical protein